MAFDESTKQHLKKWSEQKKRKHSDLEATRTGMFMKDEQSSGKTLAKLLIFLIIIIGALYIDYLIISSQGSYSYKNLLQPFDTRGDESQKVKDYLLYLCGIVESSGIEGIANKWVDGIPPSFMNNANRKLGKMATQGYVVDSIELNKDSIYHFRCHPIGDYSDIIFIDITKQTIDGKSIFRLLRVY